jgi:hypothetical protein
MFGEKGFEPVDPETGDQVMPTGKQYETHD